MHQVDQDVIDDFLLAVTEAGLNLKGQFLKHLVQTAVDGEEAPSLSVVKNLLPRQLLAMAKSWKNGDLDLESLRHSTEDA